MSKTQDLAEFKKLLHSEMQDAALALLPRYFEMLQDTEDPEELRKGLAFFVQTVGAEAEKKQDPYGNLPVVQITFNNGQLQASAATVELVEPAAPLLADATADILGDLAELDRTLGLSPTRSMVSNAAINADLDLD